MRTLKRRRVTNGRSNRFGFLRLRSRILTSAGSSLPRVTARWPNGRSMPRSRVVFQRSCACQAALCSLRPKLLTPWKKDHGGDSSPGPVGMRRRDRSRRLPTSRIIPSFTLLRSMRWRIAHGPGYAYPTKSSGSSQHDQAVTPSRRLPGATNSLRTDERWRIIGEANSHCSPCPTMSAVQPESVPTQRTNSGSMT